MSIEIGGRALGWAQCGVLLFVGGFCTFHLLYPLRHFALYPAGVSWHEEGHLGAWHMKLRSKHGWVALVAVEQDGKRTVYLPQMDPMANGKQKKKIVSRPHALLLYATELAKLHIVANRSLTSLHAHSCFALNARAPLPLFTPEADLLDHLGSYELLPPFSSSAVGVWLTGQPPVANAAGASDSDINKITWENSCRFFGWDPFKLTPKDKATVGALRVKGADVDVSIRPRAEWARLYDEKQFART